MTGLIDLVQSHTNTKQQEATKLAQDLKNRISDLDELKRAVDAEYKLVKDLSNRDMRQALSNDFPNTESDLSLFGCNFENWPEQCWSPTLYVDDYDAYQMCFELAGCSDLGANARRPFFDLMTLRRKQ